MSGRIARHRETAERAAGLALIALGVYLAPWAVSVGHHDLYLYTERGSGAQALYERLLANNKRRPL